jgi:hypothetical protein
MDELELDDEDGIVTDDEALDIPPIEVRVPPAWTAKMSAKALRQAAPMELPALIEEVSGAIDARVKLLGAQELTGTDLPTFVWDHLSARHNGSHKAVEQSLSALINGVEASWGASVAVQAFGELCGMLSAEHSEVVSRRVLGLLAPTATPSLVPECGVAACLAAEDGDADGELPLSGVLEALPRLRLGASEESALSGELTSLAEASGDGESVRLDRLLLSATAAMRKHASGAPADVVEEEEGLRAAMAAASARSVAADAPPDEVEAEVEAEDDADDFEEEEEEEAEEAVGGDDEDEEAGAAGSAGGAWQALASVLRVGSELLAAAQREALFDRLDADADGQLALDELEGSLPAVLCEEAAKAQPRPRGGVPSSMPLLSEAVSRAFEAAKALSATVQLRESSLSRDGFDRVLAYLHATCVMLSLLETPADAKEVDDFDADAHAALLPRLPGAWRVDAEEAQAAFGLLEAEQPGPMGRVRGDDCLHALAMRALPRLCDEPGGGPHSRAPPPHAASGRGGEEEEDEDEDEAAAADPYSRSGGGGRYGGGAHEEVLPPPAPHGLGTVFETTERSAFSATGDWGKSDESGGMNGNRSLGVDANLSSVKVGFFDASKLGDISDSDDDGGGQTGGGSLRQKYDRVKAELRELKQQQQAEREQHRAAVRKMLQANEVLQAQLRDLNGVVERVVQRSLGISSNTTTPRLPAGAFPAQAKPSSRQQREKPPSAAAPPRTRQPPAAAGARPIK